MIEIIPNWHPFLVHYTIALLTMTSVFYLMGKILGRDSLQAAGDWCLTFGLIFVALSTCAGLQAYMTVAHDVPSHAAMTVHRNWALGAAALWSVIAVWRLLTRSKPVDTGLLILTIVGALALLAVGYRGAELVYRYGLGVENLPAASGDTHDHEHDHEETGVDTDPVDEDIQVEVHEDGADHDHTAGSEGDSDLATPEGTVDAFHAALHSGDEATVEALLHADVVIFEGGGSERSFEEYASHHMRADMAFVSQMNSTVSQRDVIIEGNTARVMTEGRMRGTYNEREVDNPTLETIILERSGEGWRIVHIHWS